MRCEHLHDSGVYVLGVMSLPEREVYESHLAGCATCRAEVAGFGELPELLGKLDAVTVQELTTAEAWAGPSIVAKVPEKWAGPSITAKIGSSRKRWRSASTMLVAACLGVLAVLGVQAVRPGTPEYSAMQEVSATVPIEAKLALESAADGTVVRMVCIDKPGRTATAKWTYKLVVVPKSGAPEELDTWTAGVGDEYQLKAHTDVKRDDIDKVEIRKGDGTAVLSLTA